MSLRFRRTVTLLPGVRLNISKTGFSLSIGPRGASLTLGKRGLFANLGLPGTGLSYRSRVGGKKQKTMQSTSANSGAKPSKSRP